MTSLRLPILAILASTLLLLLVKNPNFQTTNSTTTPTPTPSETPTPTPIPSPTLTPTPKPLTFAQLNEIYGPCTTLPVLTYHHIENLDLAKKNHRTGLAVTPDMFASHLEYLQSKGYNSAHTNILTNFFLNSTPPPQKSIILTFDDGYDDFYTQAFPLLKKYNTKAVLYLPTGLVDNPGYLTWSQINELASSGLVEIGNHTWSHHSAKDTPHTVRDEITIADTQLNNKNLNPHKTFAYPYGHTSSSATTILQELNYQTAFTTRLGSTMCTKQKLNLPRTRIGNAPLSNFGI